MRGVSATLLLSGGIDSVAVLSLLRVDRTLFVDYGQPAAAQERAAARRWSDRFDVQHYEMTISGLRLGEMADESGKPGPRIVQARNAILISCAANLCAPGDVVLIGAHADDARAYPDCRPSFLLALSNALVEPYGVKVEAPLHQGTREQILETLRENHLEFQSCWSCYAPLPNGQQCGACNSCRQPR